MPEASATAPVTPSPRAANGRLGCLIPALLFTSVLANLAFVGVWLFADSEETLAERRQGGDAGAKDKIAIVRVEGMILELFTGYATRQLGEAARDDAVKAVVLVINSPGGTITASDLLHKQIKDLRDGKWEGQAFPKPVVAAMESIAASGGYYIAAPADRIIAQPTTITGSIGIFAAVPDLSQVPERYGIDMKLFKRGELKGATLFRKLSPAQARNLEEMLEHGYQRFMQAVRDGRGPRLKHGLREPLPVAKGEEVILENGEAYTRRLADGGIFTSTEAVAYGLVDEIGYLDTAIDRAKGLAGLEKARVIAYVRPVPYWRSLLGIQADAPERTLSADLVPGLSARLWYLTPGYELSGLPVPVEWFK